MIERLKKDFEEKGLEVEFLTRSRGKSDLLLLVNGCKHACLEEKYAPFPEDIPVISVKGEMVGSKYINEKDIPKFLVRQIVKLI